MQHTVEWKTERLILRPLSDDALTHRAANETDTHMRAAYYEMLDGCLREPHRRLWRTCWVMTRADGVEIGDCCFKGAPEGGETEIGYGVATAHCGQGYATEAVNAMADWAFSADGALLRLTAQVEPGNEASKRVLEKAGFVPAGYGPEGELYHRRRPGPARSHEAD